MFTSPRRLLGILALDNPVEVFRPVTRVPLPAFRDAVLPSPIYLAARFVSAIACFAWRRLCRVMYCARSLTAEWYPKCFDYSE